MKQWLKDIGEVCWYVLGIMLLVVVLMASIYASAFEHAKSYFQQHPEKLTK